MTKFPKTKGPKLAKHCRPGDIREMNYNVVMTNLCNRIVQATPETPANVDRMYTDTYLHKCWHRITKPLCTCSKAPRCREDMSCFTKKAPTSCTCGTKHQQCRTTAHDLETRADWLSLVGMGGGGEEKTEMDGEVKEFRCLWHCERFVNTKYVIRVHVRKLQPILKAECTQQF